MEEGDFLNSYCSTDSPYVTILPSVSGNTDTSNVASPAKKESGIFSPFKTSGLSPFKLMGQSPSKGSLDDWEKDFMANFQENLFGMDENMVSTNVLEDIVNSPVGKALIENRMSPLRMRNGPAVRRLKISPHNKNTTKSFQSLSTSDDSGIGGLMNDFNVVKEEDIENDHLYGQTVIGRNPNTLSAIDPNKMSATPIKPSPTQTDNVPKRKLAMKMPGPTVPFQAFVIQDNALCGIQQVEKEWPSKERLKYARLQFQHVLNKAVEKEIEILREERRRKKETSKEKENRNQLQKISDKTKIKTKKVKGGKVKGNGKRSRPDKFPQIKMALSKPTTKRKPGSKGPKINKKLFFATSNSINRDLGWYPSDDDDDDEDEIDCWSGPVPFNGGTSEAYCDDEESSDDEQSIFKFETQSGRQVVWKKRRY